MFQSTGSGNGSRWVSALRLLSASMIRMASQTQSLVVSLQRSIAVIGLLAAQLGPQPLAFLVLGGAAGGEAGGHPLVETAEEQHPQRKADHKRDREAHQERDLE